MVENKKEILDFFFGSCQLKESETKKEPVPTSSLLFNFDKKKSIEAIKKKQNEANLQKFSSIYKERIENRNKTNNFYYPDGLLVFDDGFDEFKVHAIEIYNRFNFKHSYDTTLPIIKHAKSILELIRAFPVSIICGSTGSGKTTQVPQLILDDHRVKDQYCNILITQPRRIAASSVALRVSAERNWQIGEIVGYSISHDKKNSQDTRICYLTTGVIVERIIINMSVLECYTHIIIDEVHERNEEIDLLILILKQYIKDKSSHLKIVLMSATLDVTSFADYFATDVGGQKIPAPSLNIEGRSYNVDTFFLKEIDFVSKDIQNSLSQLLESPIFDDKMIELIVQILINLDKFERDNYLTSNSEDSAVLVFLPGIPEIEDCEKKLSVYCSRRRMIVRTLHSRISPEEQAYVFRKTDKGFRKVILATNIAESSITVPDIKYVIDTCLHKQLEWDKDTSLSCLKLNWVSKSSAEQRKGRAGRVANGICFRLVSKNIFEDFIEYPVPELKRCSLEHAIIKVKRIEIGPPTLILKSALDPPQMDDIEKSFLNLKEIGALTMDFSGVETTLDGELTFLGKIIGCLPLDVRLGKFIGIAHIFGFLDEAIIISAMLSVRNIYFYKPKDSFDIYLQNMQLSNDTFCDHLLHLEIYKKYKLASRQENFEANKRKWALHNHLNLKALQEADLIISEIFGRLQVYGLHAHTHALNRNLSFDPKQILLFKVVLAASFYPFYFISGTVDFDLCKRTVDNNCLFNTFYVSGLQRNQMNVNLIKNHLKEISIKDIKFIATKAVVQVAETENNRLLAEPLLYLSVKKRQTMSTLANKMNQNGILTPKEPIPFCGPFSPLELNFIGITKQLSIRSVSISPNSVNSVSLYNDKEPNKYYPLVASDIALSYGKGKILIRNSTLLPSTNGFIQLLSLLFSPNVELRVDDTGKNYGGAICGLGYFKQDGTSFNPENDMDIQFTFDLTQKDIEMINLIRHSLNIILCNKEDIMNSEMIKNVGGHLSSVILELFEQERDEKTYICKDFSTFEWNKLPPKFTKDMVVTRNCIFKPIIQLLE